MELRSIRHRSQNFFKAVAAGGWCGTFVELGAGAGAAGGDLQGLLLVGQSSTALRGPDPDGRLSDTARDKFQQFFFFGVKAHQIQFIDRVRTFLLCSRDVKTFEIPQVQFLGEVVVSVDVQRQMLVSRQCRKLWRFRISCSSTRGRRSCEMQQFSETVGVPQMDDLEAV